MFPTETPPTVKPPIDPFNPSGVPGMQVSIVTPETRLTRLRNAIWPVFASKRRKAITVSCVALALLLMASGMTIFSLSLWQQHTSPAKNASGSTGQTALNKDGSSKDSTGTTNADGSKTDTTDKDKKAAEDKAAADAAAGSGASSGSGGSSAGTSGGGTSGGGTNGGGGGGTTTSYPYPARWSVGAPGVGHYTQTDATLPVPAGYTEVSGNGTPGEWDIYDCSSPVVYDHYYFHSFIYIGTGCSGSITIKNSIIAPPPGTNQRSILNNSNGGVTLTIQDTTIRPEPVGLGGTNDALTDHAVNNCGATCHITLTRLDVSNSGGMCLCGENTLVQNSWLHDAYIAHLADPGTAHTGGVFPYGGSGPVEVSHNRLEPGYNAGTGGEVTNYWKAITAVLFTQSSGGTSLHGYNVHDNFISLGSFDVGLEDGIGIIFKNNVFGPSHWGPTTTCSSGCTVTYSDWSGNVMGDINGVPNATVVDHP